MTAMAVRRMPSEKICRPYNSRNLELVSSQEFRGIFQLSNSPMKMLNRFVSRKLQESIAIEVRRSIRLVDRLLFHRLQRLEVKAMATKIETSIMAADLTACPIGSCHFRSHTSSNCKFKLRGYSKGMLEQISPHISRVGDSGTRIFEAVTTGARGGSVFVDGVREVGTIGMCDSVRKGCAFAVLVVPHVVLHGIHEVKGLAGSKPWNSEDLPLLHSPLV